MMALIVLTTSFETTTELSSACAASVLTALWMASCAWSDLGLNSLLRRAPKSLNSWPCASGWASVFASDMGLLLRSGRRLRVLGFRRRRDGLEQRRVGQHLADQLLRAALAVHVGDEVGELGARLEQLVERADLAGDRRRREIVHALEGDVEAEIALAGERVRHLEGDARLHRLETIVEIVDVDQHRLAIGDARQRLGRLAREIGQHAHDEGELHLLLRAENFDVVFDLNARRAIARDKLLTAHFRHLKSS